MNAVAHERVVEYLNSHSGDMVTLLESLTRIESPSSDAAFFFLTFGLVTIGASSMVMLRPSCFGDASTLARSVSSDDS